MLLFTSVFSWANRRREYECRYAVPGPKTALCAAIFGGRYVCCSYCQGTSTLWLGFPTVWNRQETRLYFYYTFTFYQVFLFTFFILSFLICLVETHEESIDFGCRYAAHAAKALTWDNALYGWGLPVVWNWQETNKEWKHSSRHQDSPWVPLFWGGRGAARVLVTPYMLKHMNLPGYLNFGKPWYWQCFGDPS